MAIVSVHQIDPERSSGLRGRVYVHEAGLEAYGAKKDIEAQRTATRHGLEVLARETRGTPGLHQVIAQVWATPVGDKFKKMVDLFTYTREIVSDTLVVDCSVSTDGVVPKEEHRRIADAFTLSRIGNFEVGRRKSDSLGDLLNKLPDSFEFYNSGDHFLIVRYSSDAKRAKQMERTAEIFEIEREKILRFGVTVAIYYESTVRSEERIEFFGFDTSETWKGNPEIYTWAVQCGEKYEEPFSISCGEAIILLGAEELWRAETKCSPRTPEDLFSRFVGFVGKLHYVGKPKIIDLLDE